MPFRRGFKSQCERRSVEFRKRFGLEEDAALSADRLARALGVTVWSADQVEGVSADATRVLVDESDPSWSALAMRIGPHHLIVYKPASSPGRRNSVIMHELSHVILGHELASACILEDGSLVPGNFKQEQEDEADWLAGTLLLPRPALMSIRRRRLSDVDACREHLVSQDMVAWRFRMTGVDYQLAKRQV